MDGKIPVLSPCGAGSITSAFKGHVPVKFTPEVHVESRVKSAQFLGACLARAVVRTESTESQKVELPHLGADGKSARHRKTTQCIARPRCLGVEFR